MIEEKPAPGLSEAQRAGLFAAAIKLGAAVNYRSAGTVEFVFDADSGAFYFLEVNTRLQVEHGVTEEVMRLDLVEWMVRLAAGDRSFLDGFTPEPRGHSIQVRIYAEDPHKNFQPSCGVLTEVAFHRDARNETWVENGTEVTPFYDPMLAKIIVLADDRATAIARLSGDKYLLVEYGPLVLDLALRFRAHALMQWLEQNHLSGILDLTPGIRSLQIHYDGRVLPLKELMALLLHAEASLPDLEAIEVPSRIVHLPLSWDDPQTQLAIQKYMSGVRPDAPWCPSNLEFIRRINGLTDLDEVQRIVFDASYLVLGLGDVYLGAPVAAPLDPRHRLVTTKYNPARTWTPENAVGIGGAYMCIYGMEGPGGYQFVGRTVQVWNSHRTTHDFEPGKPWLLRFFDQVRFYPVSAEVLLRHRADFLTGRFQIRTEETTFRLKDYQAFLGEHAEDIAAFRAKQRAAFAEERERWVAAGEKLIILESMKMETAICAPCAGKVRRILVAAGRTVEAGQALVVLI